MSFVFRAQAALELRTREEEDALRALGSARQGVAAAASAVASAEAVLADAFRRARDDRRNATDVHMSGWLSNWLAGQRRQLAGLHQALARRRDEEHAAARALLEATRRVRTLVHLRDRLWREYQRQEQRAEEQALNWLGSLRYFASRVADNAEAAPEAHGAR